MIPLSIADIGKRTLDILQCYFDRTQSAEEHREEETKAVVKIQSVWRRKSVRLLLKNWKRHATEIQKRYRGHLGRIKALDIRRKKEKLLRLAYFGRKAKTIQRHFRGFWSRKFVHDFYKRREFIDNSIRAGKRLLEDITLDHELQWQREQEQAEKNIQHVIDDFIATSHYRVGTEAKKGAFYSPLIAIFGRGRSYLEEHIKDARRRQVTGMELWKLKGYDEYGIPIKMANNKFFVKQSKVPHSRLSMDTRRRLEEAALLSSVLGTYITHVGIGPYESKVDIVNRQIREKELQNPHMEDFKNYGLHDRTDFNHLPFPSVRQGAEFGQRERLRKEEKARLEREFPRMVEEPFALHVASGKVFDLDNNMFYKVFPKRHHHTHYPHGYQDFDHGLGSSLNKGTQPRKDLGRDSMSIDRRHSRRPSHVH